jgi:hypothetical protein
MLIAALKLILISGDKPVRRTPALFVLGIVAAISIGCSASDQGSAPNTNAPGTTTYSNTTNTPSGAGGGGGATTTAPKSSPSSSNSTGETKIKPPTDK